MAESILEDPKLFERLIGQLNTRIVGEAKAKKAILGVSFTSYVENPQTATNHSIITAESCTGKDKLLENALALFPKNRTIIRKGITPTIVKYLCKKFSDDPNFTWNGKLVGFTDVGTPTLNHEDFKRFLTEEGTFSVTDRNPATKALSAIDIEKKGFPVVLLTTAEAKPNAEILNRFSGIQMDESEEQTKRINKLRANRACSGEDINPAYDQTVLNSIAELKPYKTIFSDFDPEKLGDALPTELRARRDSGRIFDLASGLAVLHQKQRKVNENGFLEVDGADWELARKCLEGMYIGKKANFSRVVFKVYTAAKKHFCGPSPLGNDIKGEWFTVDDLYFKEPTCAASKDQLYEHIGDLAAKGALDCSEKIDLETYADGTPKSRGRTPKIYKIREDIAPLSLPPFEAIKKDTTPKNPINPEYPINPISPKIQEKAIFGDFGVSGGAKMSFKGQGK